MHLFAATDNGINRTTVDTFNATDAACLIDDCNTFLFLGRRFDAGQGSHIIAQQIG
jgi:hypothetical protein